MIPAHLKGENGQLAGRAPITAARRLNALNLRGEGSGTSFF
jgi:hypothetical protein